MQLYAGSTNEFISDAVQHRLAEMLGESYYQYFRFRASASEFASWQNSLTALTAHLQYAGLRDQGIALELQLPLSSSRLDAMLTGHDAQGSERAVIVELKQWTTVEATDTDDCVVTYLGGKLRELPHPSLQVANYRQYLGDMNSAFHRRPAGIELDACSWLHNLDNDSRAFLTSERFADVLAAAPLFTGHDADGFRTFLQERLAAGDGLPIRGESPQGATHRVRSCLPTRRAL